MVILVLFSADDRYFCVARFTIITFHVDVTIRVPHHYREPLCVCVTRENNSHCHDESAREWPNNVTLHHQLPHLQNCQHSLD